MIVQRARVRSDDRLASGKTQASYRRETDRRSASVCTWPRGGGERPINTPLPSLARRSLGTSGHRASTQAASSRRSGRTCDRWPSGQFGLSRWRRQLRQITKSNDKTPPTHRTDWHFASGFQDSRCTRAGSSDIAVAEDPRGVLVLRDGVAADSCLLRGASLRSKPAPGT